MTGTRRVATVAARAQLQVWLVRSGVPARELARQLGITPAYLSQVRHGDRRPKLETLVQLASITGIPVTAWVDTKASVLVERTKRTAKTSILTGRIEAA